MKLFFWRKDKPEPVTKVNLVDLSLNAEERESLYRLMHSLDGIELHRRVDEPIEMVKDVADTMNHFAKKGVQLPWDVNLLKQEIVSYEVRSGGAS